MESWIACTFSLVLNMIFQLLLNGSHLLPWKRHCGKTRQKMTNKLGYCHEPVPEKTNPLRVIFSLSLIFKVDNESILDLNRSAPKPNAASDSPSPMHQIKFNCHWPTGLRDVHVWKCLQTDGQTLAQVPTYMLTL